MKRASGIEKNTPQKPQRVPKTMIASRIENASRSMVFEKSTGVSA